MEANPPSFFTRLGLAFRILSDARFAARCVEPVPALAELPSGAHSDSSPAAGGNAPCDSEITSPGTPAAIERASTPAPLDERALREQGALQLLSLLQREGRLVDFLQQEIAGFSDAEVAAAVRVVHEGSRKALQARMRLEPVRPEAEGSRIELDADFDADRIKLTGNLSGKPPYRGVLQHAGWKTSRLALPEATGQHDVHTLAPAEVEL